MSRTTTHIQRSIQSIQGAARFDRRTKRLVPRLHAGDIAIIDHADLDGVAAEALVARQVAAVVNLSPFITGRYPNPGPSILLRAAIPMYECHDPRLADTLQEGDTVTITGDMLCLSRLPEVSFPLQRLDEERVQQLLVLAQQRLKNELRAFAQNTLEYLQEESEALLDVLEVPEINTTIAGRHAVVVVRGEQFKQDLIAIRNYLREVRPILIGVDGGADALLEMGFKPHIIVGDMDSVSDRALQCGAELVVHQYTSAERKSPGIERVQRMGLPHTVWRAPGTSEDIAMLLAYEKGAQLIVAVGTHFSLLEFLEKGRRGMSSTFLTRLRVGDRLVDAKGVSRLYPQRFAWREFSWLFVAAMMPVVVAFLLSPAGRDLVRLLYVWLRLRLHF
ncbi:MAG: putative cytokinetic ring protein SteA [Armatimonadota bacterium]|nr:putative cytokinetic ring protein SteA [bacterium]MDW8320599.1 putative cytokinetic ring protein SteA [Armatimonadota bacterium]